jgi:hypothetical protein
MSIMRAVVLRANGLKEEHTIPKLNYMNTIQKMIGADSLDTVNVFKNADIGPQFTMRQPVMVLDDLGYQKELTTNVAATVLYLSICRPGTTHEILGDVVIIDDADFE